MSDDPFCHAGSVASMTSVLSTREQVAPLLSSAPKTIVVLVAYLDESGLNPTAKSTVVGGLIGPISDWIKFEGKWRDRLPARFKAFHTQRCQRGTKEYADMSEAVRMQLYDDLAEIAASYGFSAVSGSVPADAWREAETDLAFRKRYPTPYALAFELCLVDIHREAKRTKTPVHVVYGFSDAYAKRAALVAQAYTASQRYAHWICGCAPNKPEAVIPLQAADMLCYEVYHQWQTLKTGAPIDLQQRLIPRLGYSAIGYHLDRAGIETISRNGPVGFID